MVPAAAAAAAAATAAAAAAAAVAAAAAAIHARHHIYCRMQLRTRAERFESMKECVKVT